MNQGNKNEAAFLGTDEEKQKESAPSASEILNPVAEREVFIAEVTELVQDAPIHEKVQILSLLFFHSIEDGMKVAKKVGISNSETFTSLIASSNGTDEIASALLEQIEKDIEYLSPDEKEVVQSVSEKFKAQSENAEKRKKPTVPKKLQETIEEYYTPFIAQKRLREKVSPTAKPSDRALTLLFEKNRSLRETDFYFPTVAEYIQEKTGKEIAWNGESVIPKHEVEALFKKHKLSFEEAVANKALKQKEVYTEIYTAIKRQARKELEKEIDESLQSRGYEKSDYAIVEKNGEFVIEFEEGVEGKEQVTDYDRAKLDALENESHKENADPYHIALGLAGVSTPEAMELRRELLDKGANLSSIAMGLAGVSTPEAMELRRELLTNGADPYHIALGLAGVATQEAMELRQELLTNGADPYSIAEGLAGVDTTAAMELRQELLTNGADLGYIARGLAGVATHEAMELRRELLTNRADPDYIAEGLAGVSTPEAMKLRQELLTNGADPNHIALALAGVATQEAMELRRELLKNRADPNHIARGLAGVDTTAAMELRQELLTNGADPYHIARGLAGVATQEAMELRKELEEIYGVSLYKTYCSGNFVLDGAVLKNTLPTIEKHSGEIFSKEYITQTLSQLQELLTQDADPAYIAMGLAGVSTPEAMELRRELLTNGADPYHIALGLAGVATQEAMELRQELLTNGANLSSIAEGLAGVATPEAMELRRELLTKGANSNSIALGLAGVATQEAMELRQELLTNGANLSSIAEGLAGVATPEAMDLRRELLDKGTHPIYIAEGLAGVATPEAMELRRELLTNGADPYHIALGLAGVATPEAMELRRELLTNGADPYHIALGLAGVSTPEAMELRRELLEKGVPSHHIALGLAGVATPEAMELRQKLVAQGVSDSLVYSYAFCNAESAMYMTKLFDTTDTTEDLITYEKERLEKLTLTEYSDKEKEMAFLEEHELSMAELMSQSDTFASQINRLVSESPALFFDDIRAKGKKIKPWELVHLEHQLFPSIKEAKERESRMKGGSGLNAFFGGGESAGMNNAPGNADSFFRDTDSLDLFGGDPSMEGAHESIIEFRKPVQGMLCSSIALTGNRNNARWEKIELPLNNTLTGPVEEITAEIPQVNLQELVLPRFTDAKVIPERVKLLDENGKEVDFDFEVDQMGQYTVRAKETFSKIIYSQEKQTVPSIPTNIDESQYQKFRQNFEKKYGKKGTEQIADLPSELKMFIKSIKHLSPIEQVAEVEEMTRRMSVYDMNNKDVMSLKRGKGNDERLSIMEMRIDEMSEKEDVGEGKKYAGVCADFAMLSTAMLREAGFVSGVIAGLKINGTKADALNAHAVSFALWPRNDGKYDMFTIDGTPDGRTTNEQEIIDTMREKSLRERIKEAEAKADIVAEEAERQLEEIEKLLEENDLEAIKKLSNGKLETILNNLLQYKVKTHHLQIIDSVLSAGKYGGVDLSDTVAATQFIENEIERERGGEVTRVVDNAGKAFFETVSDFVRRYKDEGNTSQESIQKVERVLKLSEKYLSDTEAKAAFATINYLKAKNLV